MPDDLFEVAGDGSLVLRVHVQPGAGRTAVVGRHGDALKVKVAAPPEQGRANDACVALVAQIAGVKPAAVELVSGASSRSKRFKVTGLEPDELGAALDRALEDAPLGGSTGGNTRPDTNRSVPRR
ncbi:MAG TPA: DUF167 domain-containing protein [Acidimicrobiales bacterium]